MDLSSILTIVWYILSRGILLFTYIVVPLGAVYQEYKIWQPKNLPSLSLYGLFKVYLLNVVWITVCLIGSVLIFPKYLLTGDASHEAHVYVERYVAYITTILFVGSVEVRGTEHLPPEEPGSPAPVYICNHSSQLDVQATYYALRPWKWIAKQSVLLIPGVGQLLWLGKHILIDRAGRGHRSSTRSLYEKSNAAVQSGLPMFLFPQGTRRMAVRLPFKDGAFNIALKNKSALVCMSLEIPLDAWNRVYPIPTGRRPAPIVLTIHPPIPITGTEDKEELKKRCFDIIYSVLPPLPGGEAAATTTALGGDEGKKQK